MELTDFAGKHREAVYLLLRHYAALQKPFLLHSELVDEFERFCSQNPLGSLLRASPLAATIQIMQEAAIGAQWVYFSVRPQIACWKYYRFHLDAIRMEAITASQFLAFQEQLVLGSQPPRLWPLNIDMGAFAGTRPRLQDSRFIGRGMEFLSRYLANQLFKELATGGPRLLRFLRSHGYHGQPLLLNGRIRRLDELRNALRRGEDFLSSFSGDVAWETVRPKLQELGFERGWGKNTARVRDSFSLLIDTLEAPDAGNLARFLARIPMLFKIVILSPHGYFSQGNILGLPDTGGQIVYILDQVRALEKEMQRQLTEQGLAEIKPRILVITRLIPEAQDLGCDQRLEPVAGTENAAILRVPFRTATGEVLPHWVSRFEVWPYLERYTLDVEREILAELVGKPDLLIGNYSDGNLVATLLSQRLQVTQCNIAHALEKAKYLYSDLYWRENDAQYHFACQFTADLIAMNSADFIVTSTYQEIAGDRHSVGQYESYGAYTLPGLYQVTQGIDVFDPKFNIVPPGADAEAYFPYSAKERRLEGLQQEIITLLFGDHPKAWGKLQDPSKPLLFSMARLDRIKNITGLVEWYGRCKRLRQQVNLVVVAGYVDAAQSSDREERGQIERMHQLLEEYALDGEVRWLGMLLEKPLAGELYRFIADTRGAFVQPALFEAFGLTVVEAMSSGLPTFATCYGGPLEIIHDGVSGFHINPNHGEEAANRMAHFFERCAADPAYWEKLSQGALHRIQTHYNWPLYVERIMTLARVYGFWKYFADSEREGARRYLEMFYNLQLHPLSSL